MKLITLKSFGFILAVSLWFDNCNCPCGSQANVTLEERVAKDLQQLDKIIEKPEMKTIEEIIATETTCNDVETSKP